MLKSSSTDVSNITNIQAVMSFCNFQIVYLLYSNLLLIVGITTLWCLCECVETKYMSQNC